MPDIPEQSASSNPFSFESPAFIANPFPTFDRMREESPVHRHAEGYWSLARHEDLVSAVRNHAVFSNAGGGYNTAQRGLGTYGPEVQRRRLSSRDQPSHGALRRLMQPSFTPRSIDALSPGVNAIVGQLMDEVRRVRAPSGAGARAPEGAGARSGRGSDFVRDFAYPLAVLSMNLVLGVPEEIRHLFREYTGTVDDKVGEYFRQLTRMKEESPGDDMTSHLIAAARAGHEYLDASEVNYMLAALWTAGNWTTTLLIANGMVLLEEMPEVRAALAADESLVPGFVEEALRFSPPVIITFKTALVDTEIRGQKIARGERVMFCYGAANRDPRVFRDPDTFDLRRAPNPHVSFTEGIHRCLGAPLARVEAVAAFRALTRPGCNIRLDMRGVQPSVEGPFWGYRALPVKLPEDAGRG